MKYNNTLKHCMPPLQYAYILYFAAAIQWPPWGE
jgi:hypothetical protein